MTSKEQFRSLPMRKAVLGTYRLLKNGKISKSQFDEALKDWWRHNREHSLIQDIHEVFGS